jgi:cell wall-associated NlpC family hydrolase
MFSVLALCCTACTTPRRDNASPTSSPASQKKKPVVGTPVSHEEDFSGDVVLPPDSADAPNNPKENDLAIYAMGLVDTPYKYGGNSLDDGLDCSGFVGYVFQKVIGKRLPRTSFEISHVGANVGQKNLKPGDLVFFNTRRKPYSHVGIYVGDGRFVHAPGSGKAIMLANMGQKYWHSRYNGARRIM